MIKSWVLIITMMCVHVTIFFIKCINLMLLNIICWNIIKTFLHSNAYKRYFIRRRLFTYIVKGKFPCQGIELNEYHLYRSSLLFSSHWHGVHACYSTELSPSIYIHTHTHTHTHIYIYILVYIVMKSAQYQW